MKLNLREISAAPLLNRDAKAGSASHLGWGYFMAALGAALFAMKAIFVKMAYQPTGGLSENHVDAITLLTLRMGFSVPVYALIAVILIRKIKREGKEMPALTSVLKAALLGMIGYYICAMLDFQGIKYITAQLERMLLFTYPAFILILGALFFGYRLTLWGVLSIIVAYSGIALIFLGGDIAIGINVPLGSAMIIGCAIAFASFQLLAKKHIDILGGSLFTCAAMIGAGVTIFVHFFSVNIANDTVVQAFDLPPRIYMIGVAIAVISTLAPSFLVNIALGRVGPQAVAMFGMASPIATIVAAVWWLDEPFGWVDAFGTGLTIFGIGLYTWFDKRTKSSQEKASL